MRKVISISMPPALANLINTEIAQGKFASKSEFFRYLARKWAKNKNMQLPDISVRKSI